jgi:hypothetical protein
MVTNLFISAIFMGARSDYARIEDCFFCNLVRMDARGSATIPIRSTDEFGLEGLSSVRFGMVGIYAGYIA